MSQSSLQHTHATSRTKSASEQAGPKRVDDETGDVVFCRAGARMRVRTTGRAGFHSFLPSIPILPTDRSNSFRCPQTKLAMVPCLSNATRIVSSSLAACAPCVPLGVTCMHARVCHPWSQNDPFLFDLAVMRIKTHLRHGSHGIRQSHRRRTGDRHTTRTDLAPITQ